MISFNSYGVITLTLKTVSTKQQCSLNNNNNSCEIKTTTVVKKQ